MDTDADSWVAVLALQDGVRLRPADARHVRLLAEVLDSCPPLLVESSSLLIVDGHMRRDAAVMLGRSELPVCWVTGDQAQLLERALRANAGHGLALSFRQRRAGALQLLTLSPGMSARRVALACGVSEGTVRTVRSELAARCPGAQDVQVDSRVGVDGKVYPLDAVVRREQAATLLRTDPGRSDREIAREVGLSPTTVASVRRRLGDEPSIASKPSTEDRRPGLRVRILIAKAVWWRVTGWLRRVLAWPPFG